MPLKLMNLNRK